LAGVHGEDVFEILVVGRFNSVSH